MLLGGHGGEEDRPARPLGEGDEGLGDRQQGGEARGVVERAVVDDGLSDGPAFVPVVVVVAV